MKCIWLYVRWSSLRGEQLHYAEVADFRELIYVGRANLTKGKDGMRLRQSRINAVIGQILNSCRDMPANGLELLIGEIKYMCQSRVAVVFRNSSVSLSR